MLYDNSVIKTQFEKYLLEQFQKLTTTPTLHIIQVGDDFASSRYISIKQKVGARLGVNVEFHHFVQSATLAEVHELVQNISTENTGLIYQLPLSDGLSVLADIILPQMDVDLLSIDQEVLWKKGFLPPTIGAIDLTLKDIMKFTQSDFEQNITSSIDLSGMIVAVIGQGRLVGKPLLRYLGDRGATIISINVDTKNPSKLTLLADIVICGAGSKNLVDASWLQPGTIVIDAATSEDSGSLVGDVDIHNISDDTILSPSPGGVGKLTVLYLFYNLLRCQTSL
jgi:methylenetetrahydrofolate dehydrogenase (NADP+) / methenyltetrahydrofolate cyclohydrolase